MNRRHNKQGDNMTGRLIRRAGQPSAIGEGTHKYHRGKRKYSRHYPSMDAKIHAKKKLKNMSAKSRRGYRHTAD